MSERAEHKGIEILARVIMTEEEKELLEGYRKLTPESKLIALSNFRAIIATQELTKKSMSEEAEKKSA